MFQKQYVPACRNLLSYLAFPQIDMQKKVTQLIAEHPVDSHLSLKKMSTLKLNLFCFVLIDFAQTNCICNNLTKNRHHLVYTKIRFG